MIGDEMPAVMQLCRALCKPSKPGPSPLVGCLSIAFPISDFFQSLEQLERWVQGVPLSVRQSINLFVRLSTRTPAFDPVQSSPSLIDKHYSSLVCPSNI